MAAGAGRHGGGEARERFLAPLLEYPEAAGLGHVSEIADAEPPHTPRGCPFQAWSLGELVRVLRMVEAEGGTLGRARGVGGLASEPEPT